MILRPGVVAQRPPGVVQPTEIKIAPEISGRLFRFAVAPGQTVRKGDILAELSNPELEAALVLGQAQLGQARAARDRIYAGPRQEQVDCSRATSTWQRQIWFTRSNNSTERRN